MRSKTIMVCGIGINDADYEVVRHETSNGRRRISWMCPIYRAWKNMLNRCTSASFPTYKDCTVCDEWLSFSGFHAWMKDKDYVGMDLDKDVLVPGNKEYGPDFCIFIPHALNSFLLDRASRRGALPIGVTIHAQSGKYRAKCRNPWTDKTEHLGLFFSAGGAHLAWRERKHELACSYADQQSDPRIAKALRARFAQGVDQC